MGFLLSSNSSDPSVKTTIGEIRNYFIDPHLWTVIILALIKIIIIWVAGRVFAKISKKAIEHMMQEREKSPIKFDPRRTKTIGHLVSNIITYTVNFLMILLIVNQLGFNLAPLLAGAGVLGLAIGFGAQNLVKDVIMGFFIIFEDQFGVGDVIQIGSFKGTVEGIGMRITRLRNWTGEVHIIPNGTIQQVTNFSLHNSVAYIDVSVAYEENVERVVEVLKEEALRLYDVTPDMVSPPEVLGVQNLGASDVVIRVTAECKNNTHFTVMRMMRADFKKALERQGIEIPYPKVVNLLQPSIMEESREEKAGTHGT